MIARLLTDYELMILLAVLRLGSDAYGVRIAREIEETARRRVVLAAVYTALDRLQQQGLVTSQMGEPTAERGGRAKRYFAVTARGLSQVKQAQRALQALWDGIPELKGTRA
jgi:PadR family transcriptional regulator PadR